MLEMIYLLNIALTKARRVTRIFRISLLRDLTRLLATIMIAEKSPSDNITVLRPIQRNVTT